MTAAFVIMRCLLCDHVVWVEGGGRAAWGGACPKCNTNSWEYLGQTTDKLAGIRAACDDL